MHMFFFFFFAVAVTICSGNTEDLLKEALVNCTATLDGATADVKRLSEKYYVTGRQVEEYKKKFETCQSEKADLKVLCAPVVEKAQEDQLRALGDGMCTTLFTLSQGSISLPFINNGYPTAGR